MRIDGNGGVVASSNDQSRSSGGGGQQETAVGSRDGALPPGFGQANSQPALDDIVVQMQAMMAQLALGAAQRQFSRIRESNNEFRRAQQEEAAQLGDEN